METSDSEYFESADEDFVSDDEDTKTVKNAPEKVESNDNKSINTITNKVKDVKLTEIEFDNSVDNKKTSDNPQVENLPKDDDNNISRMESSKKDKIKKEATKKLCTKLDNSKNKPPETPAEENTNVPHPQPVPGLLETTSEAQNTKTVIEDEDNLWDETEIDWGKEDDKEENMWDNDDWEPVEDEKPEESKLDKTPPENTGWSSWGNWGVSSILSTATQSVSTLTQGITNVIETGIGVPEPEELAKINQAEKLTKACPDDADKRQQGFGLGNLVMGVSQLTKLVETTSTRVISGGLDTLETIGKKTMEVLQEGDPGLKKKRAFLTIDQDKPVLSQLLREAKEKAENENKKLEDKHFAKRAKNYETLFDDHQGLVHLEALEMLSKQCDIKLQTLLESYTDESLTDMQETMEQVKELSELPDEDEDEQANWTDIKEKLNSATAEINIPISYRKLIDSWEETETWLNNLKLDICDERELHQQAVETLAQLTAMAVEQFHKTGELLLVKEHRSTADEADSLVQLTTSLTSLIGIVAAKFSDKLNAKSSNSKNKEEINGLITNVFFEAANSSSYIQDAFQLLIPVLQVGAV